MELLSALKNMGFTQQEAILYIQLCEKGELSGYEAAKITGISRSNAYASLSSLADKGYANIIEGQTTKYIAIPKDELIQNLTRRFDEDIKAIDSLLKFNTISREPYITIAGDINVINKLKNIIENSEKRIYLSCNEAILLMVESEIKSAIEKELKVVILAPRPLTKEVTNYTYHPIESDNYFKIIVDTAIVQAGTLEQTLYSKNDTLVSIIKDSFINEISVIDNSKK